MQKKVITVEDLVAVASVYNGYASLVEKLLMYTVTASMVGKLLVGYYSAAGDRPETSRQRLRTLAARSVEWSGKRLLGRTGRHAIASVYTMLICVPVSAAADVKDRLLELTADFPSDPKDSPFAASGQQRVTHNCL
ncbi:hypothetical protein ColTof4_13567 [Colletotrichum tofieldiae]|nr:hypothetical protein ColTof3_14519 [Colletotrichum tofieldiae]GKT81144.1 hypothetical protein ColTof4_13567 [Colletotrichum tofieldiae]GKT97342.1 hypothetical protein Ct61P_15192 [Colletotrichum tofieldiae]